jgi:hypothetical protein
MLACVRFHRRMWHQEGLSDKTLEKHVATTETGRTMACFPFDTRLHRTKFHQARSSTVRQGVRVELRRVGICRPFWLVSRPGIRIEGRFRQGILSTRSAVVFVG